MFRAAVNVACLERTCHIALTRVGKRIDVRAIGACASSSQRSLQAPHLGYTKSAKRHHIFGNCGLRQDAAAGAQHTFGSANGYEDIQLLELVIAHAAVNNEI